MIAAREFGTTSHRNSNANLAGGRCAHRGNMRKEEDIWLEYNSCC
jgi:hypothetical protein